MYSKLYKYSQSQRVRFGYTINGVKIRQFMVIQLLNKANKPVQTDKTNVDSSFLVRLLHSFFNWLFARLCVFICLLPCDARVELQFLVGLENGSIYLHFSINFVKTPFSFAMCSLGTIVLSRTDCVATKK